METAEKEIGLNTQRIYGWLYQAINATSFSDAIYVFDGCSKFAIDNVKKRDEDYHNINENYSHLLANVSACKNGKEAEKYVRSLGFDLPEEEENKVTALSTPLDASFLFYGKEA